ncbi:protein lap4 [Trichonephila clavipes]|nr:protein lap4 [Trichonephila clavipes]
MLAEMVDYGGSYHKDSSGSLRARLYEIASKVAEITWVIAPTAPCLCSLLGAFAILLGSFTLRSLGQELVFFLINPNVTSRTVVNDIPMLDIDHCSAVQILRNAGNAIKFTVLRERTNIQKEIIEPTPGNIPHLNVQMRQVSLSPKFDAAPRNMQVSTDAEIKSYNSFGPANCNSEISYRPINDSVQHSGNGYPLPSPQQTTVPNTFHHQTKISSFEPDMTSTPMSLSRASCKSTPDIIQPSTLNSLVHSASYDTKDKYEGPVVKVTIQNPRPYIPLTPELPPPTKALGDTSEVLTRSSYSETTLSRITSNSLVSNAHITEEVAVPRLNGSLGLSIMGGCDQTCFPFGNGKPGIYVSRIVRNGTAARTGKIRVGDRILKVLDESRSFFRVHTGYFSNIPKCIKAEFIASWACSQSSVVSSSKR